MIEFAMIILFVIYFNLFGYWLAIKTYPFEKHSRIAIENEMLKKELKQEKELNAEIKARFVKCNTCTQEMKDKCLMFSENLCEGERCNELVDIMTLINKDDLVIH